MKAYPYFKWYPADAETDEWYSSLNDQELGFFHRCLNKAWTNNGLPPDMDALASLMRVNRKYLDKLWGKVGERFSPTDTIHPRLVNPRQEKERLEAISKSQKATKSIRTRYERRENEPLRASVSVYVSPEEKEPEKEKPPSGRFEEWWALWSSIKGTNRRYNAEQVYIREVMTALEEDCFECTRSYLQSLDDPTKGYHPHNFLIEQRKDLYKARWPERPPKNGQWNGTGKNPKEIDYESWDK